MTAIRRDTAGLEKELQKAINQYDDLLATLKKTIDSVLPKVSVFASIVTCFYFISKKWFTTNTEFDID